MKLWETRPGALGERVERFTAGEDAVLDGRLLYFDLCGTAAHVEGLGRIGILTSKEVARVRDALQALWTQRLEIRPQDEDVHTAVENALTQTLGELGEKVHTGRSRNDQVLVDLRLYAKSQLLALDVSVLALAKSLLKLAQRHEFVPMPGFTHTRQAMPSSVGLWAGSFVEGLLEDRVALQAALRLVDQCPLGAAAGYGVPLPLAREGVSELLGFSRVQANALNAVAGRAKLDFAVLGALATLMLDLSRLSADLIWYSSETLPYFELPEAFCTGSSIMPNKRNPDVLELVRAKGARVQAHANRAFAIAHGQVSGYHRDHQECKGALLDGLDTALSCVEILVPLVDGLGVNAPVLAGAVGPELFAVDAMLEHVKGGLPLRQAYRAVKARLGAVLAPTDVGAALRARAHLGGPGRLELGALAKTREAAARSCAKTRRAFAATLERLISCG